MRKNDEGIRHIFDSSYPPLEKVIFLSFHSIIRIPNPTLNDSTLLDHSNPLPGTQLLDFFLPLDHLTGLLSVLSRHQHILETTRIHALVQRSC